MLAVSRFDIKPEPTPPASPQPQLTAREEAQELADRILGRSRDRRANVHPQRRYNTEPRLTFNRRRAEELAAEIFGRDRDFKKERRQQRERVKQARERKAGVQGRCWDWLLHEGNVHYACNGSSFATYNKLDADQSKRILRDNGAIGIGTVNLVVPRAHGAPDVCTITLYDVLHIPSMPCNGISIPRLRRAGAGVMRGPERTMVLHGLEVAQLFEARPAGIGALHRVCLFGELENAVKMELPAEIPFSVELTGSDGEAERLGRLAREYKGEGWEFKALSGEVHGVAC